MQESVRAADRLDQIVSYWAAGLSLGTAGLLIVGSLGIINRVVRPALALAHTADSFGTGDFSARAAVLHKDELSELARTFNNMADDIADREAERLRFTAMVAHDLKNPALAIEMATRMLRESMDDEKERGFCLDAIAEETKRVRKIVRDLTDDIQVASGLLTAPRLRYVGREG